jgi:sterol desaturase/sphingolipid hydroxylase (fatty acid hydroxylase superfamily)
MTAADLQILAAAALIFIPLERLLPLHRGQRALRMGLGTDVLHLFVSGLLIRGGFIGAALLLSLAAASLVPEELQALVRTQPLWLQFAELLVLSDFGFYLAHRTVHSVPWLWRFHAVHHSSEELDWLATYRVHPVDQIFNSAVIALPGIVIGFSPEALLVYAFVYRWHAMLLHSNLGIGLGFLERVVASPRFHHWHHADEPEAYDRNFGGQLVIWDQLFGTAYHKQRLPSRYGVGSTLRLDYVEHLVEPFRRERSPESRAPELQSQIR